MGFFGGGGAAPANMVGATSSAAGTAGLVPAPAAGDQNKCLTGAATFLPNLILPSGDYPSGCFIAPTLALNPSSSTLEQTDGSIIFHSFFLPKAITISGIQIRNSSTGTAIVRLGLYSMDMTSGKPSSLLSDAGTVDCSATSSEKTATISGGYAATSGWIFAAFAYSKTGGKTAVNFFGKFGGSDNFFNGIVFGKTRINDGSAADFSDTTYSGGSLPSSPTLSRSNSGYSRPAINLSI